MGFENDEFYIKRWPQLDAMQFKDVLISFPDAIPCGVKVAEDSGKIILNPDDNYVLQEGDEVLVIAEDDDTYAPAPLPEVFFFSSFISTGAGFSKAEALVGVQVLKLKLLLIPIPMFLISYLVNKRHI